MIVDLVLILKKNLFLFFILQLYFESNTDCIVYRLNQKKFIY